MAASLEGHADNAAPALLGGLTSVVDHEDGEPRGASMAVARRAAGDRRDAGAGLATAKARAALPDVVSRKDAVFNLQRVLSLVHALQTGEYERLREAVRDTWHQPARAALVPQLAQVLALDDRGDPRRVSFGRGTVGGGARAAGFSAPRTAVDVDVRAGRVVP